MLLRPLILAAVVALALLLSGCASPAERIALARIPTMGPAINNSESSADGELVFSANTNCAEAGEVVTFTVRMTNDTPEPLVLSGTPPFEMVTGPLRDPQAPRRWSDSADYPVRFPTVLVPGEVYTASWRWTAVPPRDRGPYGETNLWVVLITGPTLVNKIGYAGGEIGVEIGIDSFSPAQGIYTCQQMRQRTFGS